MTQNDIDDGRLNLVIGIAPLKPAEFVIFRIGQWQDESASSATREECRRGR
jgi:phage tail sheath protein FI